MGDGSVEEYALPLQRERGYIKLDEKDDVDPKNNLTVIQKVNFALEMAEAIAMMHNFPGGVIIHDDVHLEQFLVTEDHQHVKIQDFNRAEIMLWNNDDGEYCGHRNGPGHGEVSRTAAAPITYFLALTLVPYTISGDHPRSIKICPWTRKLMCGVSGPTCMQC